MLETPVLLLLLLVERKPFLRITNPIILKKLLELRALVSLEL
jgi:hypothetical protein